jgi:hypothetical protein
MDELVLRKLLEGIHAGDIAVDEAMSELKGWPRHQSGFANIDHHRKLRTGIPEVIFGENKSSEQIIEIARSMLQGAYVVMATRVNHEKGLAVCAALPGLEYHKQARIIIGNKDKIVMNQGRGKVGVVCAGTSDIPVAEEACLTLLCLGHDVERAYDVGVAGIHRLFACKPLLEEATVLIVVAGMEGALPSVVAGLVEAPVVAVPTSVGYGTGFGGVAALMAMLNSCAPGVAVVNIDNGFGAACMTAAINKK